MMDVGRAMTEALQAQRDRDRARQLDALWLLRPLRVPADATPRQRANLDVLNEEMAKGYEIGCRAFQMAPLVQVSRETADAMVNDREYLKDLPWDVKA